LSAELTARFVAYKFGQLSYNIQSAELTARFVAYKFGQLSYNIQSAELTACFVAYKFSQIHLLSILSGTADHSLFCDKKFCPFAFLISSSMAYYFFLQLFKL
jgi:hypothetical protein